MSPPRPPRAPRRTLFVLALLLVATAAAVPLARRGGSAAAAAPTSVRAPQEGAEPATAAGGWQEVERLESEQKYREALARVEALTAAARDAGDDAGWARGLIEEVKLRGALGEFETAVRTLHDARWPDDPVQRTALDLFYAHSLAEYRRGYSWEIRQRERVASDEEVDLQAWTAEQIHAAAQRALLDAWGRREAWGDRPIGILAAYIKQNDYPPRIRGTLRDAVTYLWADLLADSSLWPPGVGDRLDRLDLDALIAGAPLDAPSGEGAGEGAEPPAPLTDPEIHPLRKLAALLGDLESWHRAADRPEAAFEARRARLEHLWRAFDRTDDRARIRAALGDATERLGRRWEWWSTGMATLAKMVRDQDPDEAPWAMVEARRLALAAAEAHPDTVGGRRGRHLVSVIEAPSFDLSAMQTDGPARRSIRVEHRNLGTLWFRAFRLDLREQVESADDYALLPDYQKVQRVLASSRPDAAWSVELPTTPDYRDHVTYVTPPFDQPGLWVVVGSVRRDFAAKLNRRAAVDLVVTGIVLEIRPDGEGWEVTARSGPSGEPLAGVRVDLYRFDWRGGHTRVASRTSRADGRVVFDSSGWANESHFLLAARGTDAAVDPSYLSRLEQPDPERQTAALVYTDRAVYRPGQTLHWKTVVYSGLAEEGDYETRPATGLTVTLRDPHGEEVASADAETDAFGAAWGELTIPTGRLLGGWRLDTSLGGSTAVRVEEYKRPTFEVELRAPEGELRLNRPAALAGEARYYFGLPVVAGEVGWRVTREPVLPPWWWWYGGRGGRMGGAPETIAAGDAALGADGGFELAFTPEADEREAGSGVSYRFRVTAEVTDEGGETRSAERVFRLGFVAVEAAVTQGAGFFDAGDPAKFTVRRTDLDGAPRAGEGSWRVVALEPPAETLLPAEQPLNGPPPAVPLTSDRAASGGDRAAAAGDETEPYRTEGDLLRPRWDPSYDPRTVLAGWPEGAERASGRAEHGPSGEAEITVAPLPPGAYRLVYTTADAFGARFETRQEFLVVGEGGPPLPLPALLVAEHESVPVGGTARLLVHSGLDRQPLVFELYRAGRRVDRRELAGGGAPRVIELPVGRDDRGGFGARLTTLADYQQISLTRRLFVPWDDRELAVEFATFRDRIRPGNRETWRVTVRAPGGGAGETARALGPGAAQVLAYMYDRSLDLFAPHTPPEVASLYPDLTAVGSVGSSLGGGGMVWQHQDDFAPSPMWESLSGDRLVFYEGYGIGGPGRRMFVGMAFAAPGVAAPMRMQSAGYADAITVAAESPKVESANREAGQAPPPPVPEVAPAEPPAPAAEVRTDFSETAFWQPALVTGDDGSASFEFTVPDSVTEWSVWAHAVTRDLRGGSVERRTRSVKDLLVRPYLPRFLREGDRAEIKVVVQNAGDSTLAGRLEVDVLDPDGETSRLDEFGLARDAAAASFSVEPGGSQALTFPLRAPARVGPAAFRAVARAGDFSDGEQRPLPVLPGRFHLAQSRFAALHGGETRELDFPDLRADDPSRIDERLVVTLDAQLFYGVLDALPYLIDYPYECTEQTLNRFVSTGIVSSVFEKYPAVARMARELAASRDTRLERWDAPDPNRDLALEETPWLAEARGGGRGETDLDLIKVLDPEVAAAQRASALAELGKAQTSSGAFPWWPGGPPSPFMTLYLVHGFARAVEFDVEVPKPMVVNAWRYLHRHYLDEIARHMLKEDCCWELVTFLGYVLSSYPDDSWTGGVFTAEERKTMLDHSFRHWRDHSPLLKSYLALTLDRAGRHADARLVFDSVMDSAKSDPDLGTYWAPEERSWLWYNDTVEGHALALRTLTELDPDDPRRAGLVQWLMLDKKLGHWKSTRATAEVVYAMVHYLEHEGTLGAREAATVTVGPRSERFVFEPDRFTGKKNQLVVAGGEIDPATMSTVVVAQQSPGLMFASATWHFSTEKLPAEARGDLFGVTRRFFRRELSGDEWVLTPIAPGTQLAPGDQVEVQLSLTARHAAEYVHLRDPRGAGLEPETLTSGYKWDLGIGWYEEIRDSGTNFFFEWLPAGEYTFKYRLRANLGGTFKVAPATLQSMYAPEFTAYSSGAELAIGGGGPDGG